MVVCILDYPMSTSTYLYSQSKTGKPLFWRIWKEDGDTGFHVFTEYGEVGTSKPQRTRPYVFTIGKNIGKSNETTAEQQADLFMKRKYLDKMEKHGYTLSPSSASSASSASSTSNKPTPSIFYPMLANKMDNCTGKMKPFPAYAQPKLDGVRCIAYYDQTSKSVILQSRTGKPFVGLHDIEQELMTLFVKHPTLRLDGELGRFPRDGLSRHELGLSFQQVCGYVKRPKKAKKDPEYALIEFHVFDLVDSSTFRERYQTMCSFSSLFHEMRHVFCVETKLISSWEAFLVYHNDNIARGFEGTMYRTPSSTYLEKHRSRDLLKYKDMITEEYEIVGYQEAKGNDAGTVVWVVKVSDDKTFNVRPKGTRDARRHMLTHAESYIGKWLTVQFQEFTTDGIPRFPVGITIRDYE